MALEQSNEGSIMPARKSHSKECTARTQLKDAIKKVQALISDDLRQSLRVLMNSEAVWMETVASERPYVF